VLFLSKKQPLSDDSSWTEPSHEQLISKLDLPIEINANRFFWDSHWLEIWETSNVPLWTIGHNGGSASRLWCRFVVLNKLLESQLQRGKFCRLRKLSGLKITQPQPLTSASLFQVIIVILLAFFWLLNNSKECHAHISRQLNGNPFIRELDGLQHNHILLDSSSSAPFTRQFHWLPHLIHGSWSIKFTKQFQWHI
jgi:hypothetical protein